MIQENFDKIYKAFDKKDYFYTKDRIKNKLRNWKYALEKGDKGAEKYTEKDIIDHVKKTAKMEAQFGYNKLAKAIKSKDIKYLKSVLRHDQLFAKAAFYDITGKKLPKSTRDIRTFLDDMFTNESVNEGISVFDERHFGKKGIIIMIDDNGKKTSAIFKDKKNADKFNRNNIDDVKKLLDLAKKTKYPKAIDEGGYSNVTDLGNINDPNSKFNRDKINLKKWNEYSPEKIMNFVYWGKGQVPPTNKRKFDKEWETLKSQLQKKYPVKESNIKEARKPMKVTKIKDIPNIKNLVKQGKVTYRGLGMGKLYNDFYDLAGEGGTRIKIGKDEYFITDTEFEKLGGHKKISFSAPYRRR